MGAKDDRREGTGVEELPSCMSCATALLHVMCAAVPIPAVAAASVLHSAAVIGFDVDVLTPIHALWKLNRCKPGAFRF